MKSILFAIILMFLVSCNKDDDNCGCTIISLDANISLKNAAGKDLLDPNNPDSYKKNNIKIYHLINGEQKPAGLDDIIFQDSDSIYRYRTFVNYEGNDAFPITYIDWSETDRDTIISEIYKTENQTRAIKIWFNNELMWDVENGGDREFTIIK